MSAKALKAWYRVHKWTSLVCTLFLLLLCLTGLPLIFEDEINVLMGATVEPSEAAPGTPDISIDRFIEDARRRLPGDVVMYVSRDRDTPAWFVGMGKTASAREPTAIFKYDAHTGAMIHDIPQRQGLMFTIRALHVDLFAGLPGTLFIGAVGLCFLASMASGIVLYAPFMRKLAFGTVRAAKAPRARWLDLHNLLGIAAAAWLLVVAVTGTINTLTLPLLGLWQGTELAEMTKAWRGQPAPSTYSSAERAAETARQAVPDMDVAFVGFPGGLFSTPHHYMVFMRGDTALTSRLLKPVMIDAETGALTDSRTLPWYLTAILLAQPLHFGDYGGLPLKIIWALFDLVAIGVLGSGLYLWLARRRTPIESRIAEIERLAS
ncbi:MAG: PepSY domain-containing protein [Proteobacteria bacterium]|nr:PepSY domain-containing protein [Pseudomonadota bacterium]